MSTREVENIKHLQFKHPFNALISGPSQSGKTTVLRDVLENHDQTINDLNKNVINVVWCYGKWQKYYDKPIKGVSFKYIEGLPNEDDVKDFDIIVLDDLMHKIDKSPFVQLLFTAGTHHDRQSVIVLTQNFYQKGEISNTLRKNAHYVILFKDPGDISHAQTMSWRMFPENPKYLLSAYRLATALPHGYLLIDRSQGTDDNCRLRTRIVPNKETDFKLRPIGFDPI
jgi:hypothetical protein